MEHKLVGRIFSGEEINWRSKETLRGLKVGFCEVCGFHHAYPYPEDDFLSKYYNSYEIPFPLHKEELDRIAGLVHSKIKNPASIIDLGCGKGELLAMLDEHGFTNLYGTEVGPMREEAKKLKSATIFSFNIFDLCKWCKEESRTFDCVILINVLEHIPGPISLMKQLKGILSSDSILLFCVPNDFNVLQEVYLKKTRRRPWFLTLPDHVNYFSLKTIDKFLEKTGYEIIHKTVQYPLEMFLLQGDDYVAMPEIGKSCHNKRVKFTEAFKEAGQEQELEQLYEGFAEMGIGRDMYIFAKPIF